ncbi:MAG TPA: RNA polymerase sigma factor SigF [Allocoleopsis sp.]
MQTTTTSQELKLENLRLLQDYQQSQSSTIRNRLVEINLGLVRKEAHYWVHQCHENFEDLMQVGCIGLIRAIEKFNASKGNAFSSFAVPYIRGEIQHYLRDKSVTVRLPRQWLDIQKQAVNVTQNLRIQLKRQPTDTEIAASLNISIQEWQEIKLAYHNREPLSLDMPLGDSEDGATSLADTVPDHNYRSFQLAQEDQLRLQQALVQLENKTRQVLEFVFLHDLTQKEVAQELNISVVTVSRRVKKGLESLKNLMDAYED